MKVTDPNYTPPLLYTFKIKSTAPIARQLGFHFDLPWPLPSTVGSHYYGEGAIPDRRELVYNTTGQYYATDGIIPSTGGIPMVHVQDPIYKYKRSDHTVKI